MNTDEALAKEKKDLREVMKRRRGAFSGEERKRAEERICQRLLELPSFKTAEMVFGYASFGSELGTWAFLSACLALRKQLYLPRVKGMQMTFARVNDLKNDLTPGIWGILEPNETCPVFEQAAVWPGSGEQAGVPEQISGEQSHGDAPVFVLLPGLAFDRRGRRLGYGGGFYDRFFSSKDGFFLTGACFSFQIADTVPAGSKDISADVLVTETNEITI